MAITCVWHVFPVRHPLHDGFQKGSRHLFSKFSSQCCAPCLFCNVLLHVALFPMGCCIACAGAGVLRHGAHIDLRPVAVGLDGRGAVGAAQVKCRWSSGPVACGATAQVQVELRPGCRWSSAKTRLQVELSAMCKLSSASPWPRCSSGSACASRAQAQALANQAWCVGMGPKGLCRCVVSVYAGRVVQCGRAPGPANLNTPTPIVMPPHGNLLCCTRLHPNSQHQTHLTSSPWTLLSI